jgi:predicted outer membrane repeat protein
MAKLSPLLLLTAACFWWSFTEAQSVRHERRIFKVDENVDVKAAEQSLFAEDLDFSRHLQDDASMSMPFECDYRVSDKLLTWPDHQAIAEAQNCNLASILNRSELNDILPLIEPLLELDPDEPPSQPGDPPPGDQVWLGGMHIEGQSWERGPENWEWVDESPWSFEYWTFNDPNNYEDRNENRVSMYIDSGTWNDKNEVTEINYGIYKCCEEYIPPEGCISDFYALNALVEFSRTSASSIPIVLCEGAIEFVTQIEMKDAKFDMKCESDSGSCQFDGKSTTRFFEAGRLNFNLGDTIETTWSDHVATFENIAFVNGVDYPTVGLGGALRIQGGDTTFRRCTFKNNSSGGGGALFLTAKVLIDSCIFEDNFSEEHGGAIYAEEKIRSGDILNVSIRNSKFFDNVAVYGDADPVPPYAGQDIYKDGSPKGFFDCGAGSGNQFCDSNPPGNSSTATCCPYENICLGADTSC